jgi:transposase
MVAEVRPDYPTEWAAMKAVASKLGVGSAETVRQWVRRDPVDAGQRPGTMTEESAQVKALKGGCRAEAGERDPQGRGEFFAAELDRPHLRS